ncbi:MAG: protein-glutamine glutaminase family protein [bacterium]|nr:protein-glutamine glutaminase family protein [bacterium]
MELVRPDDYASFLVPFSHTADGCDARCFASNVVLMELGYDMKNVYIQGLAREGRDGSEGLGAKFTLADESEGVVPWVYHVAPMVMFEGKSWVLPVAV